MLHHKPIVFIFATIFMLNACSNNSQEGAINKIKKISGQELVQLQKDKNNLLVLDVRTPEEVSNGAILNAVTLDFYDENFETNLQKLDSKRPVVVYCKSGGRSGKASKILEKVGFTEIYDLKDGYKSWKATQ